MPGKGAIMDIQKFKRQIKEAGLEAKKRNGLEVLEVRENGVEIFSITYAQIFPLTDINSLLDKHLRIEAK